MRAALLMVVMAGLLVGGCYRRVVSAKGLGAMGTQVEPSYRPNTKADQALDKLLQSKREVKKTQKWSNEADWRSVKLLPSAP
jgi:hypothetical protein